MGGDAGIQEEQRNHTAWQTHRNIRDFEHFKTELDELNRDSLFSQANYNIDEMCEIFTSKVLELANHNIPYKTITLRPNDKPGFIQNQFRIRRIKQKSR